MDDDTTPPERVRPKLTENDLGALGAGVGDRTVVSVVLHLQIVYPNALSVHASGGDIDDSCGRLELPDQQVRQQEVAQEVGGERLLEPVLGLDAFGE